MSADGIRKLPLVILVIVIAKIESDDTNNEDYRGNPTLPLTFGRAPTGPPRRYLDWSVE